MKYNITNLSGRDITIVDGRKMYFSIYKHENSQQLSFYVNYNARNDRLSGGIHNDIITISISAP